MKKSCPIWLAMVIIISGLATGCASHSPKEEKIGTVSAPSDTRVTATTAEETSSSLTAEEELLFEDDVDDWQSDENQQVALVADPIEPFNRVMFKFNEKLYDWLLRPIALGYRKITPEKVRTGVGNFFTNLSTPVRFTNCLLQGKGRAATVELSKFIFNSTFGVLGFGDLFQDYPEMYPDAEDLGQTLGSYGAGEGFYIVWPILGPSTLRDTVGSVGDFFLEPLNYVDPTEVRLAAEGIDRVNMISFRIEDIDAGRKAAIDIYEASRNFVIQSRRSKINK
ncbi:MAG: VacJ family lipoprotein [Desulfobacteraceae bacterium]